MDVILASVRWQFALGYLEDIAVFSKSPQDHIEQMRSVLKLLYKAGGTLSLKKCRLFAENINYLRHVIWTGRFEPAEHTTNTVAKLKYTTTKMEPCSFLGLCNVFWRFVPKFARLVAPLNKKLRKNQTKHFGPLDKKESAAVASLKEALIQPSARDLPRSEGQSTLDTDICDK